MQDGRVRMRKGGMHQRESQGEEGGHAGRESQGQGHAGRESQGEEGPGGMQDGRVRERKGGMQDERVRKTVFSLQAADQTSG